MQRIAYISNVNNSQRHYHPNHPTHKIDPVIRQPLPAADVNRHRAAGVERMFLGFLVIFRAEVHGLRGCAEE